ncbi:ATP-binding protein [Phenylobacterium montanum]|nr:ATP-binding protein [Caulobacter sp. S6]
MEPTPEPNASVPLDRSTRDSGASARRRRKLGLTLGAATVIATSAIGGDYLFNVVLFRHPESFTPLVSLLIGLIVGVPMSFALISQRIDIEGAKELLARSVAEKEAALEEAKRAAAVKADFLANMTHELRTPLNAIVGFSGLLKHSTALSPEDARKVTLIADASEALLRVVNDVLDFSKLDAGAIELEHDPFDPHALADSVMALLAQQAEAKGLALSVTVEGPRDLLVGDGGRLGQVLLNLASNAVKFTPSGEVEIKVSQRDGYAGRRLRLAVRDTGIGVPAELSGQIFERFTQADASVSRQYGGTGLGLAICRRIIEAMGGAIGVDSAGGAGSIFWCEVSLPLADGRATNEPEAAAPAPEGSVRLLLVDDNAVNRELVASLLSPFGVEIETAENGLAAVEAAATSAYDLILMDVQMPVMDGLTATRRIRAELGPRPPIIAMTANVLPEQVARCLDAGMDAHLGKPITPRDLLEAVARWSRSEVEPAPQTFSAASSLSSPSSSNASEMVSG